MRRAGLNRDLVEFSFQSRAVDDLAPAGASRLARQTWSSNLRAGLTGELRLEDGCFFHVVEGPCEKVLKLAARILTDPRHTAIRVLAFRALPARLHATWTVAGFDLGLTELTGPRPMSANLRFLEARAAARALELGRSAS
jgi:hypothetical protein